MKRSPMLLLFVAILLVLGGCTHNLLKMDEDGDLLQRTSGASVSKINNEGTQLAAYHGLAPTTLKQDAEGNWMNTPGPVSVMSFPLPGGGIAYIVSPKDTILEGIEWTPEPAAGQPAFKAAKISANLSDPLDRHVSAVTVALAALEGMTKAEAEATVQKWAEAGKIVPSVVDLLMAVIAAVF